MATTLLLVRHALPAVDPAVRPDRWHLGPPGRAAARDLARLVGTPAHYVTSPEPKARETVEGLAGGAPVTADVGFAEVHRPHAWSDGYRARARAYVQGLPHRGWEPHSDVVARFDAAVARHAALAEARDRTLVIGTHGLALTLWLASRLHLEPGPEHFWAALRFPDVLEVDRATASVRSLIST